MTTTQDAQAELGYAVLLRFAYDWMGRRIAKEASYTDLDPNDGIDPPDDTDLRFVYDGWNLAAEFDATGTELELKRCYTWGLDLSGTFQGAGGVGGLLEVTYPAAAPEIDKTAFPAYDGNGNIIAWSAAEASHVEPGKDTILRLLDYDPFGNVHVRHSPEDRDETVFAEEIPFGFSTKYEDAETGLFYYGFRYYNPSVGRWISRDPIRERGGLNLYGFVGNSGVTAYDILGLDFIAISTRPVGGVVPGAGHYSIEYWVADCPGPKDYIHESTFLFTVARKEHKAARSGWIELVNFKDYKVKAKWQTGGYYMGEGVSSPVRTQTGIVEAVYMGSGVSVVFAGADDEYSFHTSIGLDKTRMLRSVYDSQAAINGKQRTDAQVKAKWNQIKEVGKDYEWAEWGGYDSPPPVTERWPKFKYKATGSNSNTFGRYVIKQVFITWRGQHLSPGFLGHPGKDWPEQNPVPKTWIGKPFLQNAGEGE